jgi:hypothetical protein
MLEPVTFSTKALADTTTLASGDIRVRGYLTRWNELDIEGDRMVRGSFLASIPDFMAGSRPLCWTHDKSKVIGKVIDLHEDAIGVLMEAVVWRPSPGSILQPFYDAVRGLGKIGASVGAFFRRDPLADGSKAITGVRITECSLAPVPMLSTAAVEVVEEGKALSWGWNEPDDDPMVWAQRRVLARRLRQAEIGVARLELLRMRAELEQLRR